MRQSNTLNVDTTAHEFHVASSLNDTAQNKVTGTLSSYSPDICVDVGEEPLSHDDGKSTGLFISGRPRSVTTRASDQLSCRGRRDSSSTPDNRQLSRQAADWRSTWSTCVPSNGPHRGLNAPTPCTSTSKNKTIKTGKWNLIVGFCILLRVYPLIL
jgi:hypothetical protein